MQYATQAKTLLLTPPATQVNNGSMTCAAVDRRGFDFAVIRLILGATDIALTALKLQESDDDSTWSDIPGLDFSAASALPAATDDNKIFAFDVDLRGRKRYLKPVITVGAGSSGAYACVIADLFRAEQSPATAASRGLGATLAA